MTNEEAISILKNSKPSTSMKEGKIFERVANVCFAIDIAIEALQERKTGKWVLVNPLQKDNIGGAYACSCCKSGSWEVIPKTWKACPWCTALMEVEE